jgi:hypothetical protein
MTKALLTIALVSGLILSFHDTLWPWAFIPGAFLWVMIILALAYGRTEGS